MSDEALPPGWLVAKIPPCTRDGGHGKHALITRTASCEGVEPIPHRRVSEFTGSFGPWIDCACGHSFIDWRLSGESLTAWERHAAAHLDGSGE